MTSHDADNVTETSYKNIIKMSQTRRFKVAIIWSLDVIGDQSRPVFNVSENDVGLLLGKVALVKKGELKRQELEATSRPK